MGGAFPSSCGCTCDQATSQDLQPLVPSRWTGVGRRLQDPGADDCGAVWGAGDAGAAGGPGRGDGWPGKPGLILALVNDGAVGNVGSRGSHSSLSFPLGPGALRAPRPGAWCIPASSLFCPGLGGAPEWVLLRGPRWGPGSPAAINSGVWVGRGQQHSRACEPPGPTDTCMSPPGPAPPRRPGHRPSPQGMRCPAPPTPQAGAEKQKSLLPCHPPSTLGSRPPAAGASPVTHTCIYSREMLHGQVPCLSPGQRVTPPLAPPRAPPPAQGLAAAGGQLLRLLVVRLPHAGREDARPKGGRPVLGPQQPGRGRCRGGPSRAPHHRLNLDTPAHGAGAAVCPAWPQGRVRPEGEWTGRPGRRQPPRGLSPKPRASAQARGSRGDR